MNYLIRPIPYSVAKSFAKTCELWNLNLDSDNNYYGLYLEGKLVSICAYKQIGKFEARLKSNYTLKEYRCRGFMTEMIDYIYRSTNYKVYTAYCEKESLHIYLQLGFRFIKERINKKYTCYIVRKDK